MAAADYTTADIEQTLRSVVEPLAGLVRRAGSEDERRAAELIADAFSRAGARARIDEEELRDGYAALLMPLGVAGVLAGFGGRNGRRRPLRALLAAAATAGLIDDVENGRRPWRRVVPSPKTTTNVVAECGDEAADRTLVVIAHHDAAPTGQAFDPSFQRWLARRFPDLIQRTDTAIPLWWPSAAGTALAALGAATGRRAPARSGAALSALNVAVGADIARNRIVPGANDNLSGVAAMVALAERLAATPVDGIRVVLASFGAEEVLQGGIYGCADRHLRPLYPD